MANPASSGESFEEVDPRDVQEIAVDPVCGAEVDPAAEATEKATHGGRTYYFCSPECRSEFANSPTEYVA